MSLKTWMFYNEFEDDSCMFYNKFEDDSCMFSNEFGDEFTMILRTGSVEMVICIGL